MNSPHVKFGCENKPLTLDIEKPGFNRIRFVAETRAQPRSMVALCNEPTSSIVGSGFDVESSRDRGLSLRPTVDCRGQC